jgi:hypothetical protein
MKAKITTGLFEVGAEDTEYLVDGSTGEVTGGSKRGRKILQGEIQMHPMFRPESVGYLKAPALHSVFALKKEIGFEVELIKEPIDDESPSEIDGEQVVY